MFLEGSSLQTKFPTKCLFRLASLPPRYGNEMSAGRRTRQKKTVRRRTAGEKRTGLRKMEKTRNVAGKRTGQKRIAKRTRSRRTVRRKTAAERKTWSRKKEQRE